MLYLSLAIACSLAIGVIFKIVGNRGLSLLFVLAVNYVVAAAMALASTLAGAEGVARLPLTLVGLGVATGLLFVAAFTFLGTATAQVGMSLSLTVMRLSVLIPFLASWIVWGDSVGLLRGAGLVLAAVSVPLVIQRPDHVNAAGSTFGPSRKAPRFAPVLVALFLTAGVTDVAIKFFDEQYGVLGNVRSEFVALVFSSAAAACVLLFLMRRRPGRLMVRSVVPVGILLGAINYGSLEFFLMAVERLPGTVAFPVNHFSIVVGGAIIGAVFLRERLTRANVIGLCTGVLGLVLLGV